MKNLWSARFKKQLDDTVNDFNSSLPVDCRMYKEDIKGSLAHVLMLGEQNIIPPADARKIADELVCICADIDSGKIKITDAEDIHMFVETVLTERLGDVGKKLHTARSRNDQVAVDMRMYVMNKTDEIIAGLKKLIGAVCGVAALHTHTIVPGYTHLQRAQPISFAHHIMAYANMFLRDVERLEQCRERTNVMPLGSCALAGTTYNTDRFALARALGFSSPCQNSIDGVSDRDFALELCGDISIIMMHLSRFSEEIILWCSCEFSYIELDDAYSTGSSIMPQKKNPDIAELVRGKTGRVYGNLLALLTLLKGLPLAYNKDMQEDKESVFDSIDTVLLCLEVFVPMIETMTVNKENMRLAAAHGFINATDCADYLVTKGEAFRNAYKIVGELVAYCIDKKTTLEDLSLEEYRGFSPSFGEDIYECINLENCMKNRSSFGAAAPAEVERQIEYIKSKI